MVCLFSECSEVMSFIQHIKAIRRAEFNRGVINKMAYHIHHSQFLKNNFCHHPNNPTNLNLRLQPNLLQFKQRYDQKTPVTQSLSHLSLIPQAVGCSIRLILQSAQNSVYPTIFTLIHNLITYTTLRTNHQKPEKRLCHG